MDCFGAEIETGELVLKEAEEARWLGKKDLDSVKWLPADITIIDKIKKNIDKGAADMDRLEALSERITKFNKDRDWDQFHSPSNLAKSIAIEAGELLECFQWNDSEYNRDDVIEELADVTNYCIQMSQVLGVDLVDIINAKMDVSEKKYPVDKAKGVSTKYNKL